VREVLEARQLQTQTPLQQSFHLTNDLIIQQALFATVCLHLEYLRPLEQARLSHIAPCAIMLQEDLQVELDGADGVSVAYY
jgi:hypothetical protein